MRRNRIIWLCLWILSIVGISFYGGPVSYGFFTMVTLLPIVSLVYLICVFVCFRIYQNADSKWISVNQAVPFRFILKNEFFFGFSGICPRFYSDYSRISGLSDDVEYELPPKSGIEKNTELICKYRGEYEVGIRSVVMEDFLRLFRIEYKNNEPLRVVVRPQIVDLKELKSINDSSVTEEDKNAAASNPDVLTREYVPGDDVRRIHWGQTARTGTLMVKNTTGERRNGIGIVMSTERTGKTQTECLRSENKVLECTLALSYYFAGKNVPTGHFHISSNFVRLNVSGINTFNAYYETLCGVSFNDTYTENMLINTVLNTPDIFERKAVFFVVQSICKELIQLIKLLNDNHVSTVVYYICEKDGMPDLTDIIPCGSVIKISPDDDLTEVM